MAEPSTGDGVREAWGRVAPRFAAEKADVERRPSMRRLVELCGLPPTALVLDVGTGAGFTAFAFAARGCLVVGLDPTHEMLLAAREGWRERLLADEPVLVEAWAEALPFADGTFDAVVAHRATHQFASVEEFVAEARRLLKPGGLLGVADQSPPDGWEQWHNDLERLRDPTHGRALSPRQWRAVVEGAGLAWREDDLVYQEHDVEVWLDRVECPPDRRRGVVRALETIPEEIRGVYRPVLEDGRLVRRTPQLVLVATR